MVESVVVRVPPVSRRRWAILALLATAQLMLVLDVTVVNVALPDIGAGLGLSRAAVPWVLTAYTLAFGGLMLVGGRVADGVGPRRVALAGLATFTVASLLCGLAQDGGQLLAGRVLQGVGAALLSPAALALVLPAFPGPERGRAMAVWSSLSGVGAALGVVLGGVLTSGPGWRWIFTINLPIGVTILLAVPALLPRDGARHTTLRALDVPGGILVSGASAGAIFGLVRAGSDGWGAPATLLGLAAALALGAAFVGVERRTAAPLLAVALLRRRAVLAGVFLMVVATGLLVGGLFVASFVLQRVSGYSAERVGLLFLPVAVAITIGAQAAGRLLTRTTTRAVATTGLALATAGYLVALRWPGPAGVVVGLAVAAAGIGATLVTAFACALTDAPAGESGLRSAIVGTAHELGGALGVAALTTAIGAGLTAATVGTSTFRPAFGTGSAIALGSVVLAAVLVPAVRRPAGEG